MATCGTSCASSPKPAMKDQENLPSIEQGPLRPPSEARSLLIRVARNCPWNRCTFCPAYKGARFSLRDFDEICAEVRQVAALPQSHLIKSMFLQDADALIVPVERLAAIIGTIRQSLPGLDRVTAYARSHTLSRRTVAELERLKEAGLTRVHVGLESGCDEVLNYVHKGVTSAQQRDGCTRVNAAGLELCCYVMPGLGGRRFTKSHALETGRLIADIAPRHVRLRTSFVLEGTPLANEYREGRFEPLNDSETCMEIRLFLIEIAQVHTELVSDHRINLLLELQGQLPGEYRRLLGIVDRFLSLSPEEKELFIAGRRLGLIRRIDDLFREGMKETLEREKHRYQPVVPVPRDILY
jgi:radical SAM superfamily enzyme YgiQ (UPF0313 family)